MTIRLRPYQQQLVTDVRAAWDAGERNVLMQSATGSGKTATLGYIVQNHSGASCIIAHRSEILSQLSLTLARYGIRHDLIAAASTRKAIARAHVEELGTCYYQPGARCRVASVDTLVRAKGLETWFPQVTLVVHDECFPAGTLIDGKPIETLRVGDTVTAFNEKTGAYSPRKVVRTFRNLEPENMVRIDVGKHHVLHATKGHPFWTPRGWVDASDLTVADEVLIYGNVLALPQSDRKDERSSTVSSSQNEPYFLHDELRDEVPGSAPKSWENPTRAGVHGMPNEIYPDQYADDYFPENGTHLLHKNMLGCLSGAHLVGDDGANKSQVRIGSNDYKQPDASGGGLCEDQRNSQSTRLQTKRTGWKRQDGTSRSDVAPYFGRLGLRRAMLRANKTAQRFGLSASLQAGRRQRNAEAGDRGGRGFAQQPRSACAGREKGHASGWVRVDCVTIYKSADHERFGRGAGDGFVYNIEVEDLHTYVANGITVHNCHHLLRANKWGDATELFTHPDRRMLLPTATPKRADGKGLGSHHDGYADVLINGPTPRWLIEQGYLCDYRVYCPPSDMRVEGTVPASGDYSPAQLSAAASKSHIVGDLPMHYARFGEGGTGISFCVNIDIATATAAAYRELGISAEVVTGATHDYARRDIFRRFGRGEILQICVVDIVSEGTDLPSCRVGSFGRPSESLSLVWQQIGRVLRPDYAAGYPLDTQAGRLAAIAASAKPYAILIDHVGHFTKPHIGPPDRHIVWSLDRRDKRASTAQPGIPVRTCRNEQCYKPYPATSRSCTHCGWTPEPAGRSTPEQVDGDLALLDPAVLAALRGAVLDVEQTLESYQTEQMAKGARPEWIGKHVKARADAQAAQIMLRAAMGRWGGMAHAAGLSDHEIQRGFWHIFGVDYLSAQALGAADSWSLLERVDSAVSSGMVPV